MDCFGTYTLHMPKPHVTCVQSATEWTASVHTLHIRRAHKVDGRLDWTCEHTNAPAPSRIDLTCNHGRFCWMFNANSKFWNAPKKCKKLWKHSSSDAQTCDKVRAQSGTQWCASVIHMPKRVITIVFKGLRHRVVRSILYKCPNLWCYAML